MRDFLPLDKQIQGVEGLIADCHDCMLLNAGGVPASPSDVARKARSLHLLASVLETLQGISIARDNIQ